MKKLSVVLLVLLTILSAIIFASCQSTENTLVFECDGQVYHEFKAKPGEPLELPPPPSKEGYTFIGWSFDESVMDEFELNEMPEQSITLYALWEPRSYTITFDSLAAARSKQSKRRTALRFRRP